MVVGVCNLELFMGEAASLKDKRRILKSILDRVRGRFNVSIAEIDQQDLWRRATIAFTCVGNEKAYTDQVLNNVVKFIENQSPAIVTNCQFETL